MVHIEMANVNDLERIIDIDSETVGHRNREEYLRKSIINERCIIAKVESNIQGFLVFSDDFFEQSFINLIMISKDKRKNGVGTSLLKYFERIASTEKIFSSTNKSNSIMHKVFIKNGYLESGFIDNLDEGDPEIVFFKKKSTGDWLWKKI